MCHLQEVKRAPNSFFLSVLSPEVRAWSCWFFMRIVIIENMKVKYPVWMILVKLVQACKTLSWHSHWAPKLSDIFSGIENILEWNIKNNKHLRWILYFCINLSQPCYMILLSTISPEVNDGSFWFFICT